MPTITFSLKDFCELVGKKLSIEEFKTVLEYAKAELEHFQGDEVAIKFNDTNQPYLWCPEGISWLVKGVLGKEKGIPELKIKKSSNKLIVTKEVLKIRPNISAFIAKGVKLTDYSLKQLIQLQEKLCENYGRKRQKIAVGLYCASKISFPITYTATAPNAVQFIPLGENKQMTLAQILQNTQKGKEYKWILEKETKYPLLIDSKKEVLSFPPIINSQAMGKLEAGDEFLFFEATGTDQNAVNLAAVIFAQVLQDRGFEISSLTVETPTKKITSPLMETKKVKITKQQVQQLLGLELTEIEIKQLLEKARYNFTNYLVEVPQYRQDIMHCNDVIEDIAIMYGYNDIEALPITTFTRGEMSKILPFINTLRQLLVGQEFQEIFSAILSNKTIMQQKMKLAEEIVEIDNYTSQTYSAIRNSILPILLETLSQNKHVDFPQKIFEQGLVTKKKGNTLTDQETIAIAQCHSSANFTEIRQTINSFMGLLGLYDFEIKETEHQSFIAGRVAEIFVGSESIGVFGEIHPAILANFGIEMPVVACEINVEKLFERIQK